VNLESVKGLLVGGRYRLGHKLGEGGFGAVYRATHVEMGTDVAVKIMHPGRGNADAAKRFALEAKRSAGLRHPNTISVFDFGETPDGLLYIAMELLAGQSLAALLERERALSATRAKHLLVQILAALEAAHERGLVHRDLKPDNVFLVRVGKDPDFVKVLDFGIAKALDVTSGITASGTIIGTPAYMSPEQCRGLELDTRADLYSLGCMAFQMLAGRLPFASDNALGFLLAHAQEPPPDLVAVSEGAVPVTLAAWVGRCLAKAPDDRYASAEDARAALERCTTAGAEAPVVAPTNARAYETGSVTGRDALAPARRWPWIAVALFVFGALVAVLTLGGPVSGPPVEVSGAAPAAIASSRSQAPTAAAPSAVAPVVSAPTPAPPTAPPSTAPPPAPAPERSARIESTPTGATVRVAERDVGTTPYTVRWPAESGPPTVSLSLTGYVTDIVALDRDAVEQTRATILRRWPKVGTGRVGGVLAPGARPVIAPATTPPTAARPDPKKGPEAFDGPGVKPSFEKVE